MLQGIDLPGGSRGRRPGHDRSRRLFVDFDPHHKFFPDHSPGSIIPMTMIETRNVKKSFGALQVLRGVSFKIEKGEAVTIIGVSGGGKSILLKHLIGLISPDEGEVLIANEDIDCLNERQLLKVRRKFGM